MRAYFLEDSPYPNNKYRAPRISSIRNPSEKIILVEEDALTINDGAWVPPAIDFRDSSQNIGGGDLLCIRHDRKKAKPDAGWAMPKLPNADRRGNVNFVDGHAEFQTRKYVHDRAHIDPNYTY